VGYKVHVSETCDEQPPRIITNVKTTLAPIADGEMTTPIHQALQAKDLLPKYHLVDTAYLDAELLVNSQAEYDVNLVGPTRIDTGWQARQTEGGFSANNFVVDWIQQQATCPGGKTSQYWQPAKDTHGNDTIHIRFSKKDCGHCPLHTQCTRSKPPCRTVTVRSHAQQLALQAAREREKRKHTSSSMLTMPELRAPFRLEYAVLTYAVLATWVWQKPISNMFWMLVQSISLT